MPISTKFQKRINELVADSELKNADLAKAGKFDYRSLSNALVYGIIPTTSTLIKIADYFNVSIDYLLGRTDKNDFFEMSNSTFQQRFEELCKEKGVTHYKVSQDCFFDKSNISRWLSKGYLPTLEILDMITKYFNVSIDYILGRSDYKD
ncbi:MAG: helix-turn-helix transcriptional regulator [Clostridia bacterium]|nr:helix-turn-helix transcriptional regulator [Clostridia bacterium]